MKNFLLRSLKNIIELCAISSAFAAIMLFTTYNKLFILFFCISIILAILHGLFETSYSPLSLKRKPTDDEFKEIAENAFSNLTADENAAIEKVVMYVQSNGGGETFIEMDENQKLRLKTVVKEHDTEIAIDLGELVLPNRAYKAESPDWKLEMDKIIDDLSIKVKELLGDKK